MKGGYDEKTTIQRTKARPEGPRKGPAFLTVLTGELVGTVFEVPMGMSLIGRHDNAQVRLPDDGVSRRHAKIVREPDGSAKLVDLDSTNGTYINGRRIHAEGLREGDRIRVGQSATLDFRYDYRDSKARDDMALRPADTKPIPMDASPLGPSAGHDDISSTLDDLGKVYSKHGDHDAAISTFRRNLQVRELKFGKDHPAVASILDSLGEALQEADDHKEALGHHRRALAIYEAQARQPREMGHVLSHLGQCLLALGETDDALEILERAHAKLRSHGATSAELARVRFVMAKTLHELGRDEERTLDLARLARDAFAAGGPSTRELYTEVRAWLRKLGEV
ncbi:tetratricopeptide repeat protein [Paraliomyxa miuraensis]|uniref:tetratricopeptide repeat protein n=1 Tax=Paraliomyxa miuraensis TaxID=376150 RepID=UPI00225272BD|nr:tetratricopeptide repeat protein [Paraliomyxa miuraensis]MCX4246411.1 tetratricopeptide repeat protein [Paraliomyxa miuraensis]